MKRKGKKRGKGCFLQTEAKDGVKLGEQDQGGVPSNGEEYREKPNSTSLSFGERKERGENRTW